MSSIAAAPVDRRALAGIIGCIAVFGITAGMASPLISLNLEAMGVDNTLIGLNSAMLALAMLTFSPVVPRLIRRHGFRAVIFASLLLDAACYLLFILSRDIVAWFAIRILMGAALVGLFVAGETWINQVATDASRGRIMGIYATVLALTLGLGPLVITVTGTEGMLPFVAAALIVLAAGAPLLLTGDATPDMRDERPTFGVLGFMRRAPTLAAAVFVFAFVEMAVTGLLPVHGVHQGLTTALAATMLTALAAGNVILQYPLGWLADHIDRNTILIICGVGGTLGGIGLPMVIDEPALMWPLLFFWGGLFAGIYTIALAIVGGRFRGGELVTANAAFGVLWGAGSLTGPALAGMAMDAWPANGLPGIAAFACGIFVLIAIYRRLTAA